MSLSRIGLAQFRSWARLVLDLDDRPVVIFGDNGAGKTNILEALSLLAPGRGMRAASAAEQARRGPEAGWRIRARLADHAVETTAPPGGPRTVTLDDKPVSQIALGRLIRVIWLVPAMDRLFTDAPEARRRFLDRLTLSFLPDHAAAAQIYDRAMRDRNRLLREQVDDPAW